MSSEWSCFLSQLHPSKTFYVEVNKYVREQLDTDTENITGNIKRSTMTRESTILFHSLTTPGQLYRALHGLS